MILRGAELTIPVIPSKRPGTLELTNEQIYKVIDLP